MNVNFELFKIFIPSFSHAGHLQYVDIIDNVDAGKEIINVLVKKLETDEEGDHIPLDAKLKTDITAAIKDLDDVIKDAEHHVTNSQYEPSDLVAIQSSILAQASKMKTIMNTNRRKIQSKEENSPERRELIRHLAAGFDKLNRKLNVIKSVVEKHKWLRNTNKEIPILEAVGELEEYKELLMKFLNISKMVDTAIAKDFDKMIGFLDAMMAEVKELKFHP